MGIKRIYPSNADRIVFDGGLNTKYERSIIPDNESPDCLNVVFTRGAVETRQGSTAVVATGLASAPIDGLYTRHDSDGSETMVVFCNAKAYTLNTNSFVSITSADSVFTAGQRIASTEYEDHIFFGNGGAVPYKWNGTDFTRHGVYPPTTTMSVVSAGAGVLSGTYSWKVTFVNSQLVESNGGPATTFTVAAKAVTLTSIPTGLPSFGVAQRYIYRTVTSGITYMRVATLANNTTSSFTDNVSDASLTTNMPTDNGVPPNYNTIVYHQNRLFCNDAANPNFIYYSELNEPYTFGALNFVRIGDASGDIVRGLAVYENSIMVFCDKSQWLIYMPDTNPANWKPVRIKSPFGCRSPYSPVMYDNKILFAAVQNSKFVGFAAISGTTVESSATFLTVSTVGSLLKSDRIEPDMFQLQEAYLNNLSSIVYKNRVYSTVTYTSSATQNDRIYVMDFSIENLSKNQKEAWVPWTGIRASQFTIYNGGLYAGSSIADGRVLMLEDGTYNDSGSAINSYFYTKEFSGFKQDINYFKDFRFANLLVENTGDYTMDVIYRADSDAGAGNLSEVSLNPGGSLWGTMVWGEDVWGGGTTQSEVQVFLGTLAGKRVQFKFSNKNTADQRFKVHGMNFLYNLKGYR